MNKQEIRLGNDYDCIKALYNLHKNDGWIDEMVNENFIADRFIYCDTRNGLFFNDHYSYGAIVNLFNKKKNNGLGKNEYDHSKKTKALTREVWEYMSSDPSLEDFKSFLFKHVKVVLITKEENKNPNSRSIDDPVDRYKNAGIDYVYKKIDRIRWSKINSLGDLLTHFEKIKTEEFFSA